MFTPIWGRWTHFDEHIFQMGWFNHQLDMHLQPCPPKKMCVLCCYSATNGPTFRVFFCYSLQLVRSNGSTSWSWPWSAARCSKGVDVLSRKNEVGDKLLKCCFIFETKGFALIFVEVGFRHNDSKWCLGGFEDNSSGKVRCSDETAFQKAN